MAGMSIAADAIRNLITPLLPGWRVQFGRWIDGAPTDRFAVIRPVGGVPASLVRRPQFSLMLVGAVNDSAYVLHNTFITIHEAVRAYNGEMTTITVAEPVFFSTEDARPVYEISVQIIESQLPVAESALITALSPGWDVTASNLDTSVTQELPLA